MRFAALLLAFCASGCSFIFVRGPAGDHRTECTSSILAPVLDFAVAGFGGYGALGVIGTDQAKWDQQNPNTPKGPVIAFGLVSAAIWGASAIYGFRTTEACRAAEKEDAARMPPPPPD